MKTKSLPAALLVLAALLFFADTATAQCAMCRAIAGSNAESAESVVQGLNAGILYLMAMPYLMLAVLGILFYRKSVQRKLRRQPQP